MSEPQKPPATPQNERDPEAPEFFGCPNCGLQRVIQLWATIELYGQVFTYDQLECLACGWPNYYDDLDSDDWG